MLATLGTDVATWTPQLVRQSLVTAVRREHAASTQHLITATRAFLRYLAFRGEARADLAFAVPAVAHWRLAALPRHLSVDELRRVLAACEGNQPARIRDRAIVLLLARLGLRAGDVAQLRLSEIDWQAGTIHVTGKGRYQVRLPLPQEVGEAVLRYVAARPRTPDTDRVFVITASVWWMRAPSAPAHPLGTHLQARLDPADAILGSDPTEIRVGSRRPSRTDLALSPDGRWLVFAGEHAGTQQVHVRDLTRKRRVADARH